MSNGYPNIPGRRISSGDVLYTDWSNATGDCLLARAECLVKAGSSGTVNLEPQTRGDEGSTITDVTATTSVLASSAVGFSTAAYLASTSTSAGNGLQKQVRFMISTSGSWDDGSYMVVRLHPPIMFNSAREY